MNSVRLFDLNLGADQARPVPRLVNLIILEALNSESHQVHLDSGTQTIKVLRSGAWTPVMKLPPTAFKPVINRIRVMAGLDRTKGKSRQEGLIAVTTNGEPHTIRVHVQFTEAGQEEVYLYLPPSRSE